jgi:hypothetical protein
MAEQNIIMDCGWTVNAIIQMIMGNQGNIMKLYTGNILIINLLDFVEKCKF